jgi:1,4-dihydroxy-6-naphthoate synthase
MKDRLDFGLSPCPNDTFIFYRFIQSGKYQPYFLDIEELNESAMKERFPLIKVSCVTAVQLPNYEILSSGGAIGYGCGPLLVSSSNLTEKNFLEQSKNYPIFIPGKHTTANFLFHQYCQYHHIDTNSLRIEYLRYDKIIPELKKQKGVGILIHEERFNFQNHQLYKIRDLGEWWEQTTQLPIPLGCIVLHKDFLEFKKAIELDIQNSILYSQNHYQEVLPFIKRYAQSMEEDVIKSHIDLYVTDFSFDMHDKGREAIIKLKNFINNL